MIDNMGKDGNKDYWVETRNLKVLGVGNGDEARKVFGEVFSDVPESVAPLEPTPEQELRKLTKQFGMVAIREAIVKIENQARFNYDSSITPTL